MLKLREEKERTANLAIRKAKLPEKVTIPLTQHLGKMCQPIVKGGDAVKTGQLIATLEEKTVFAPIHSSISGKVSAIDDLPHPVLGRAKAVVITSDGLDEKIGFRPNSYGVISQLTPHDIRKIVFDCGVVGMGGASFPSHIKLSPPRHLDSFILNGAECEPYLTADNRLMIEKAQEILLAIDLIVKCTGVKDAYIAIEDNKPQAIKAFENALRLPAGQAGSRPYSLRVLKSQYPQGGEKQLIKAVLDREVPAGKLPFDVGAIVHNAATAYAIYEAVYLDKPLYERVVTVSGNCIRNPANLLVRIGTSIKDLEDECGPLTKEPEKIVFGGLMMGIAQYSLHTPVIKSTNGVIFLSEKEARPAEEAFCIRCARCVASCPLGLLPCMVALAAEKGKWDLAKSYGVLECMECGSCSYVCPQRRNIVQAIKYAKLKIPK
jgi:electron transport complex protein RnfC